MTMSYQHHRSNRVPSPGRWEGDGHGEVSGGGRRGARPSAVERLLTDPMESVAEEWEPGIGHAPEPAADLLAVHYPLQGEHVRLDLLEGDGGLVLRVAAEGVSVLPGVEPEPVVADRGLVCVLDAEGSRPLEKQPSPQRLVRGQQRPGDPVDRELLDLPDAV